MAFRRLFLFVFLFATLTPTTFFAAFPTYRQTSPLPMGRQMYGTAVIGDYLYVAGGNNQNDEYISEVIFAQINQDGSLSHWSRTRPLPQPRSYVNNSTVTWGNCLYVINGYDGVAESKMRTIVWSRQLPDGKLEPWRESPPSPAQGVSNTAAVATKNHLHVIGGSIADSLPSPSVWTVPIAGDGSVNEWKLGPSLPFALWFHSAEVVGEKVFVWGGLKESSSSSANEVIFISDINPDGTLSPWRVATTLLQPALYSASSTTDGRHLYSFCPRYTGGVQSNDIWRGSIASNDAVQWEKVGTNFPLKLYHGAAYDQKRQSIYIPGGRYDRENELMDPTVYFFKFEGETPSIASPSVAPMQAAPTVAKVANPRPAQPQAPRQAQPQVQRQTPSSPAASGWRATLKGFIDPNGGDEMVAAYHLPRILFVHDGNGNTAQEQAARLQGFTPDEYFGKIIFVEASASQHEELIQRLAVTHTPTWIFYDKDNLEMGRKGRIISADELRTAVKAFLQ